MLYNIYDEYPFCGQLELGEVDHNRYKLHNVAKHSVIKLCTLPNEGFSVWPQSILIACGTEHRAPETYRGGYITRGYIDTRYKLYRKPTLYSIQLPTTLTTRIIFARLAEVVKHITHLDLPTQANILKP